MSLATDKKDKKAPLWPLPVFGGIVILMVVLLSVFGVKNSILSAKNPTDEAYSTVVNYIKAYNRGDRAAVAASFVDIEIGNEMAEKSCSSGAITYPTSTRIVACTNADKDEAWVALSDIYIQMVINGVKQPPEFIAQLYHLKYCGDRFKIEDMTEKNMDIIDSQFEYCRRGFKHYKEYPDANQLIR